MKKYLELISMFLVSLMLSGCTWQPTIFDLLRLTAMLTFLAFVIISLFVCIGFAIAWVATKQSDIYKNLPKILIYLFVIIVLLPLVWICIKTVLAPCIMNFFTYGSCMLDRLTF